MQMELEHLQRQYKWRVLLSDAEHLLSRPTNTNRAQDDSNIGLLRSETPRLHRGLTLAQQQPHPQHQQQHQEEEQQRQRQRDSATNLAWKSLFFQHQEQPRSRSPSPPLLATQRDPGLCVVGESMASASSPTRGASPSPQDALSSPKRTATSGRTTPPLSKGGADAKPVDRGRMPQPQDECGPSPETGDGSVVRREDNPQQPPGCHTTSSSFSNSSPNVYPSKNENSSSTGGPPTQGNPPPPGGSSPTLPFTDEEVIALEKPPSTSNEGASVSFSVSLEAAAAAAATAAAAFTPQPNEGRQSHSEGSGSGGGRPILGKTSSSTSPLPPIPIPTAIAAASAQTGITQRNDNMVGAGADPASYGEKQGVHREGQQGQNHQSQTESNHCQSSFGGGGGGSGTGTSANTLATATKPASFQSVMLATEWMETEWKPLAVPRGITKPLVQVVSYNRPSTTVTGLQPIHPLPVFSDGNETPLRMVGAKITRDGATPANAAATIATTDRTSSSPSAGRLRGGIVSRPTWGGGGSGRGGAERGQGGEGASSPTPTLFSFLNNHADGNDSDNSFLLTTSGSGTCRIDVHSGNGRRPRGRRERGRRQSAVRAGKHDATTVVKEEDAGDEREQSDRYSQSPPPSPTAWTPPTGTRSLFSGGEV
ncbi:unnamed protein product [Ectocarpus sp. 6 AP-2014]